MSAALKHLQVRAKKELDLADVLQHEISTLQQRRDDALNRAQSLQHETNRLVLKDIVVSEHAQLRYCERVLGCDLEAVKADILSAKMLKCAETLGNGTFPVRDGIRAVVKDRVVVSILAGEKP